MREQGPISKKNPSPADLSSPVARACGPATTSDSGGVDNPDVRLFVTTDLTLQIDRDGGESALERVIPGAFQPPTGPGLPERHMFFDDHRPFARPQHSPAGRDMTAQPGVVESTVLVGPADVVLDRHERVIALLRRTHRRNDA